MVLFFQGGVRRTDLFISKRYFFHRNPYLVHHIRIFVLFCQIDTHFPGSPILELRFSRRPYLVLEIQLSRRLLFFKHIGIFQEGTPSRYFVNRSRRLLDGILFLARSQICRYKNLCYSHRQFSLYLTTNKFIKKI